MSKTDIFGKKPYKNIWVKPAKPTLKYCCVLAIRTDADVLNFSKMIYTQTNYLFSISKDKFHIEELDELSEFQLLIHEDVISDNKVFCLQNTGFQSDKFILGYADNALFQLKRQEKKKKKKNQLSLIFEEESKFGQENNRNEIQNWYDFKKQLVKNSVDILEKINYLFPLRIETYEIVKPLLQYLPKMNEINYMLIEPGRINNAMSFFTYIDWVMERINFVDKKTSFLNE